MANRRVKQWQVFAKFWYLYNAKWQCPYRSAKRIARHLTGKHKPIYEPSGDYGDHVVVINCRHIAMPENDWTNKIYYHHTGYVRGAYYTPAWEIHVKDPVKILWKETHAAVGNIPTRRQFMARLHLYPDDDIPERLLVNVSDQIKGTNLIPRRLEDYTPEEVAAFPKLFDWPDEFIIK